MCRIFLAEDDPPTQALLTSLLRAGHHEVVGVAEAADAAVAGIERLRPDLCLIDIHLAASSGIDVAERVLRRFDVPVVLMSADDQPTLPVPFILKPVSPSKLFATIDRALGSKSPSHRHAVPIQHPGHSDTGPRQRVHASSYTSDRVPTGR